MFFRKELVTRVLGIKFGWVAKGPPSTQQALAREKSYHVQMSLLR